MNPPVCFLFVSSEKILYNGGVKNRTSILRSFRGKSLLLIFTVAICLFILSCSQKEADLNNQQQDNEKEMIEPVFREVILIVNGNKITNLDFKSYFESTYPQIRLSRQRVDILKSFYDKFVERTLILTKIRDDKFTVSESDFKKYLKVLRVSDDIDLKILRQDYEIQKYLAGVVFKDITITDKKILDYYSKHRKDYKKREQILLWQIKTNTSPDALRIRTELIKNKNKFEEIARRESISVDKKNGGRMGYFEKGVLPRVIEKFVFSLKLNNISGIIESPYGFHIFKVTKKKKAQTLPLYMAKDQIFEKLTQEETIRRKRELLETLQTDYSVSRFYKKLYILELIKAPKENVKDESN
jgi:parvulin-like peptidyl-prolyl isomerase